MNHPMKICIMKKLLHPLADPVFKRIFGTEKEILIEFINTFIQLEAPVVSIEYLPTELIPHLPHEKFPVVDVRCRDTSNRQFILEIQLSIQPDFVQRAIYYASRAYERQLLRGFGYGTLEPV
jgi:predicted transposase/invertase (TIGR01784 family)